MTHERYKNGSERSYYAAIIIVLLVAVAVLLWQPVSDIIMLAPVADEVRTVVGFDAPHEQQASTRDTIALVKPTTALAFASHNDGVVNLDTVLEGLRQHPCMTMPIPELIDTIAGDDAQTELWGATALALRADEAAPYVEAALRQGDPWRQYLLARTLKDALPERHAPTLLEMATDITTHAQARVGAGYALSGIALDRSSARRIIAAAKSADAANVRRTALIALSATDISGFVHEIEDFLNHDDPFTRIHAARLLVGNGLDVTPEGLLELAQHSDYLVRQETYGVLGFFDDAGITSLLENAATNELNRSAARAARIALRQQHARSLTDPSQQASAWLEVEDDLERWQGVQYALRQDQAVGMTALAGMAQEPSLLGEMSLARLVVALLVPSARDNSLSPKPSPFIPVETKQSATENKHFVEIHRSLAQYAVGLHNARPDTLKISEAAEQTFAEWVVREDFLIMPVTHAHNPLTGRGFVRRRGFGGSGRLYVARLLDRLDAIEGRTHFSPSDKQDAWRLAGRAFHVLQDMTSPLHVFSAWHVLNSCHVEVYWDSFADEAQQIVAHHDTQPITPSEFAPTSTTHLDAFTRNALEARILDMPNTLMGYMDALAWSTYYRASYWGEIRYGDAAAGAETTPTVFDDGETADLPNVLNAMFDGNIRYHTAWWGDYFEIEDRMGNTFSWNRLLALDEWRPCPNPRRQKVSDGHTVVKDETGLRITGRFLFLHRGEKTPYCHPFTYPDGAPMEAHLPQYYGETLFPVLVAYGGGWLGALAEQYPKLFEGEATLATSHEKDGASRGALLQYILWLLGGKNTQPENFPFPEDGAWNFVLFHAPRCGCGQR